MGVSTFVVGGFTARGIVFVARALKKPLMPDKVQTWAVRQVVETPDGVIVNGRTQQPFTYADPCLEYGPTTGYDKNAATKARKAVKDFITVTLKP